MARRETDLERPMPEHPMAMRTPSVARPSLLNDLDALDPMDRAKIPYTSLKKSPDWPILTDAQKDELFRQHGGAGADQLQAGDLTAARRTHDLTEEETDLSSLGRIGQVGQTIVTDVAGPAAAGSAGRYAGATAGGALGGPAGVVAGGVVGGGLAGGAYEYGRQKLAGEEINPLKIGGAAVMEGIVGPVAQGAKWAKAGVSGLWARRASKVKAATEAAEAVVPQIERQAAGEVRQTLPTLVPRQGRLPENKLYADFRSHMQTISADPDIPTANIRQGLAEIGQRWPSPSRVPIVQRLHAATDSLRNTLSWRDPLTGRTLPLDQVKIGIDDVYKQLTELGAEIESLPAGKVRSAYEHMRGLILKDAKDYAASPGAHPAAGALLEANQAHRAGLAVKRMGQIIDGVLYDKTVPYGPKQAAALAKKLRTDKSLVQYLDDPAELDAIVEGATKIGGRTAEQVAAVRAAVPEPLPTGRVSAPQAAVGAAIDVAMGGGGTVGALVGASGRGGTVVRYMAEAAKEARKAQTITPRANLVLSGIVHSVPAALEAKRTREEVERRQRQRRPAR